MSVAAPSLLQNAAAAVPRDTALALRVGQVLDALVLSLAEDGMATLQLDTGVLATKLPASVPAGATLQLLVKSAGASPELGLLRMSLPAPPSVSPLSTIAPSAAALPSPASPPLPASMAGAAFAAATTSPTLTPSPAPVAVAGAQAALSSAPAPSPPNEAPVQAAPASLTAAPRTIPAGGAGEAPATPSPQLPPQASIPPRPDAPQPQATTAQQPAAVPAAPPSAVATPPQAAPAPLPQPTPATAVAPAPGVPVAPGAAEAAQPSIPMPATQAPAPARIPYAASVRALESASVLSLPVVPPAPPATPAEAVARALPQALAVQNSAGPLLQTLAAIVGGGPRLPPAVQQIIRQILGQRLAATAGPTATDLAQAVANSGPLLEARLANGLPVGRDMKALLLALKAALAPHAGPDATANLPGSRLPPPLRDLPPRAPEPMGPPLLPDDPQSLAKLVSGQADAALARIKLSQMAALPDADPSQPPHGLRTEIPLMAGAELVMAQLHIAPDGRSTRREQKRGWTVKFAMNFAQTGEVGAEVGIFDRTIDVSLWALDADLAEHMRGLLPQLGEAITSSGLVPGRLRVRSDAPAATSSRGGRLVDSMT